MIFYVYLFRSISVFYFFLGTNLFYFFNKAQCLHIFIDICISAFPSIVHCWIKNFGLVLQKPPSPWIQAPRLTLVIISLNAMFLNPRSTAHARYFLLKNFCQSLPLLPKRWTACTHVQDIPDIHIRDILCYLHTSSRTTYQLVQEVFIDKLPASSTLAHWTHTDEVVVEVLYSRL